MNPQQKVRNKTGNLKIKKRKEILLKERRKKEKKCLLESDFCKLKSCNQISIQIHTMSLTIVGYGPHLLTKTVKSLKSIIIIVKNLYMIILFNQKVVEN